MQYDIDQEQAGSTSKHSKLPTDHNEVGTPPYIKRMGTNPLIRERATVQSAQIMYIPMRRTETPARKPLHPDLVLAAR